MLKSGEKSASKSQIQNDEHNTQSPRSGGYSHNFHISQNKEKKDVNE